MWQIASDFITFLGWFWQNLAELFNLIFTPVKYIFTFIKALFVSAIAPPSQIEQMWSFPPEILAVFNQVPYWQVFVQVLGICLMIYFLFYLLKQAMKV